MVRESRNDPDSLSPDQPIVTASQDRLGRLPFARAISANLRAYSDPASLVVGIYGPWGSGKSSLLNLIAEDLAPRQPVHDNPPIIIRFDPWNFNSIDQLISMFFHAIWRALGTEAPNDIRQKIGVGLQSLSILLSAGRLSPVGSQYFVESSRFLGMLGRRSKEASQKTPEEIKVEIEASLNTLGRRIIVFVDDIDRLEKETIQLIFRLVRLNASFNHTTYVLAFDRHVVESALQGQEPEGMGRSYLEKIVQVAFDIPPVAKLTLQRLFIEEFDKVLGPVPDAEWDATRWDELYLGSMRHFFRNQRDVIRYINGLKLTLPIVESEINPVDFVGMETIRTFAPSVFAFIRDNRETILGEITIGHLGQEDTSSIKTEFDKVFAADNPGMSDYIRDLCLALFPTLNRIYHNTSYGPDSQIAWRQSKRVCSPDFFSRYFQLGLPEGEVSEVEVTEILALAHDQKALTDSLFSLTTKGRINQFFERWEDRLGEWPLQLTQNALLSLFAVAQGLQWEDESLFGPTQLARMINLAEALLERESDRDKRGALLKAVAQNGPSLGSVVRFVDWLDPDPGQPGLLDEDALKDARNIVLHRIRDAVEDGSLSKSPGFGEILFRWRDWAGAKEPQSFVAGLTVEDEGLLDFLVGLLTEIRSASGYSVTRTPSLRRTHVAEFIDPESLVGRVNVIRERTWDSLSQRQQSAVEAFLNPGLWG